MSTHRIWSLPRDTRIEPILRWCLGNHGVDRLMVSARMRQKADRPTLAHPEVGQAIDRLFGPWILRRDHTSEWPGTRLIGHDGLAVTVRFSEGLIDRMIAAGELFRDWTDRHSPPLPEDLCLYRSGEDKPTLLSVTHEEMIWLYTDRDLDFPGAELDPHGIADFIPPASEGFIGPSLGSSYPI